MKRTKLDEVIPLWEASLRARNRSPRTVRSYVDTARLLLSFLLMNRLPTTVGDITREHIELFITDQLNRWTPGTAAVRFRSLKPLFTWLVEREAVSSSPMGNLRAPRIPDHPVPVAGDEELVALLATCAGASFQDVRDHALLRLMIDTGARLSEVTGLRLVDLDLDSGTVGVVGKGSRPRTVPFGSKASAALDAYLGRRHEHPHAGEPKLWLSVKGALTESGVPNF